MLERQFGETTALHAELELIAALTHQEQFEEARDRVEAALASNPVAYQAEFYLNASGIYAGLGEFEKSITASRRAIELRPNYVEAHWNLAAILLLVGRLAEGLREFEWRGVDSALNPPRQYRQPQWRGETPDQAGGPLLITSEEWLGDFIQFARYCLPLAAQGHDVLLEVRPELYSLFRDGFHHERVRVIPRIPSLNRIEGDLPFSCYASIISVPARLPSGLDALTEYVPYITAPPERLPVWRKRIGEKLRNLKVGLVWAGNPGHIRDAERSIPPEKLRPLMERDDVDFYAIRKGSWDMSAFPPGSIVDLGEDIGDFADTAAIVDGLDLVISVDTAVVHMAGAMGHPVWVMVTKMPDWRWQLEGETTPWYPAVRLFRQQTRGDWDGVIAAVAAALDAFIAVSLRNNS